ncbi:MAG TPA: lysozyme inhibitor LprI family protein [Candidatus Kapabacteria bacterium]|nr:lysozyme inhibitor LprI family protein [Candidatus Kapabacteria bacterium]
MKRNYIEEIKSIQDRAIHDERYLYLIYLLSFEQCVEELKDNKNNIPLAFVKYIPIATVAFFVAFFRACIKELIDHGEPFISNITKYSHAKDIKFDLEMVSTIQAKTFTIGDFIVHILPLKNYTNIHGVMTALAGSDFNDELRNFNKKSVHDFENVKIEDYKKRNKEIIKSVYETYEFRHIFCHEVPTRAIIDWDKIYSNFKNCKTFLEHANNYINELLYPNFPETQADMRQLAYKNYCEADESLKNIIESVKRDCNVDGQLFDKAICAWKDFRKLYAESSAKQNEGGTIYPQILNIHMQSQTDNLREVLTDLHEREVKKRELMANSPICPY